MAIINERKTSNSPEATLLSLWRSRRRHGSASFAYQTRARAHVPRTARCAAATFAPNTTLPRTSLEAVTHNATATLLDLSLYARLFSRM